MLEFKLAALSGVKIVGLVNILILADEYFEMKLWFGWEIILSNT